VVFPGFRGGGEWSGAAFDFGTGVLYVNANEIPNLVSLRKLENKDPQQQLAISPGEKLYQLNCALCHSPDRNGREKFPSLIDVEKRMTSKEMEQLIQKGKGAMPGFPQLDNNEKEAIIAFLTETANIVNPNQANVESKIREDKKLKFVHSGYAQFRDEQGYPAVKPPWGTLNAIDMNKGEILWQKPLGEFPELTKKGIPPTGTQNFGGCLVTAGGLVFIGASADEKFRAFDKATGEILWEYKLPFGGHATPATYSIKGIQYVVIAAGGGGKVGTKSGDTYIAFCLPK
jgi:quinoprotein glucose dehydrogenase